METQTQTITPSIIRGLSYYSKCCLADYLRIIDPTKVTIVGTITLDSLGNFVSANAFVKI